MIFPFKYLVMKGTKEYRFNDNPKEKEFHDKFIEMFTRDSGARRTLSGIINRWQNDHQYHPKEYLSEKEETICVNLIQWLGSPGGQGFLRDCGFSVEPIYKHNYVSGIDPYVRLNWWQSILSKLGLYKDKSKGACGIVKWKKDGSVEFVKRSNY